MVTQTHLTIATVLEGAFPLNAEAVWTALPRAARGAYVLSRDGKHANFVGRAEDNLQERLLDHAGLDGYVYFWYTGASSAREAFQLECSLYHQFGEGMLLDNWRHPERPEGQTWHCPGCNYY